MEQTIEDKIRELLDGTDAFEAPEDFNPADFSGGNFDDCYELGKEHGYEEGLQDAYIRVLKMMEESKKGEWANEGYC